MDEPQFIPVDRPGELPDGTRYVLSYVEILGDSIVVRLRVLDVEAVSSFARLDVGLRDERGHELEWRSSASGGMVPGEVLHEFSGRPSDGAPTIELYMKSGGFALGTASL